MSTPGIALGRRMQGCALVAGVEFTSTAMLGRRWQPGPGSWGVVHGRSAETIAVQWKTLPQYQFVWLSTTLQSGSAM